MSVVGHDRSGVCGDPAPHRFDTRDIVCAAYIDQVGPPSRIRYGELPRPVPGRSEILVDVEAVSVNPVDTFVRSGLFRTPLDFPFVVGRDLVGTVAVVGLGTRGFTPGERVWCNSLGHEGRQGAAAESVVVPVDRLYHLPDGVDPVTAVAVVHPAATAYLALFTHGRLRPGETVVVEGAAGNVGSALVVLAAKAGARVIATASGADARHCRELGASEVIDYATPGIADQIREACPAGADLWVDTSGRNDLGIAVGGLARRGRIVVLAGARSAPVLPAGELYMKDGVVTGFVISHATTSELAQAAVAINHLLSEGALRPRAVEEQPLAAAAEVHRRLEDGELHGRRVVLLPGRSASTIRTIETRY